MNHHHRKAKRYEIKSLGGHAADAMYTAHCLGQCDGYYERPRKNPFPKGRRHDQYEHSYTLASRDHAEKDAM